MRRPTVHHEHPCGHLPGAQRAEGGWYLYTWARRRGFVVDAEHILIHGVPVQFLPAHNELAEAAVHTARTLEYDGVPVRVIDPEHLVALAFQAGGRRRRERAWQMLDAGAVDRQSLRTVLAAHGITIEIDDGP